MGVVADSVLAGGGRAYGVIPQALVDLEVAHKGLTELHVVTSMHERKAMMTDLTDAFVAIPGGIGTLDELFEAWSWNALGYHAKPFALLNEHGFWDELIAFLDTATASGFVSPARRAQLLARAPRRSIDLLLTAPPKRRWCVRPAPGTAVQHRRFRAGPSAGPQLQCVCDGACPDTRLRGTRMSLGGVLIRHHFCCQPGIGQPIAWLGAGV
jgi:uncharacterized protein (TIGR00730 family)